MAKHTKDFGFTKLEHNDFYDIEVGNNLDVIDKLLKETEGAINDIDGLGRTTEMVVGAYAATKAATSAGDTDAGPCEGKSKGNRQRHFYVV